MNETVAAILVNRHRAAAGAQVAKVSPDQELQDGVSGVSNA